MGWNSKKVNQDVKFNSFINSFAFKAREVCIRLVQTYVNNDF